MVELIIVSHGNYAIEVINSVEMILGKNNNIKALTLNKEESLESLTDRLDREIKNSDFKEFLVLVDFLGGTPFNATSKLIGKDNIKIISGVNIPMVLKILPVANRSLKEVAYIAEKEGKEGIINISNLIEKRLNKEKVEDSLNGEDI